MIRFAAVALVFVGLIGCAGNQRPDTLSTDHPAHPDASTTPLPVLSASLASSEPEPRPSQSSHAAHDHGSHGAPAVATQPGEEKSTYSCPMHPEVKSDKPGNCPICGMKLVKKS